MKVMIVTPYFYPRVGGLENYALNMAKGLKKQGYDVFVVTSNHENRARTEEKVQGLRVIRLPRLLKLSNTPVNPAWYWQFKGIIKIEKPDVINAHTPVPFIADAAERARGRIPFVLTYHNDLVKETFVANLMAKVYNFLFIRKTVRRADAIIATSDYYASRSSHLKKWREKISIVSPGVDLTRFNTKIDKTWLKKKYPGKKIVLFVGGMQKTHMHKGVDVLVRAVAQAKRKVSNIQMVAVGSGDAIPMYIRLAEELGISDIVDFPGFVPDKDLPRYFAGADVFVLPSTTDAEGFGMVLAEAMACGTPVIGTNVGGVPFLVEDNNTGTLVEPNSVSELAEAIIKSVIAGSRSYTQNAREKVVKDFDWVKLTSDTATILTRAQLPKACLIHNIISPYRLTVYEEVNNSINLTVLFCTPITKDRAWTYDLSAYTFQYKILKGFSIGPIIFNTNALRILLRTRFDVVMANSDPDIAPTAMLAFVIAKLRGKKILQWSLVTDENIHFFPAIAYSKKLMRRLLRKVISELVMLYREICFTVADHFLAFTKQAQQFLEEHGVPKEKISRTYQIMPPNLLPEPTKKFKRTGKAFLYIGYLNERKAVDVLINAFIQLGDKDARLLIAGAGPTEQKLKQQAKKDSRITFLSYVEDEAKANLYAQADVFVLPTLLDVWGLVINEAIHYGLAVICTDAAEAKDLVDNKTGVIVPASNTRALLNAMTNLLSDKALLQSMQAHNLHSPKVSDVSLATKGYVQAIKKSFEI